MYRNDLDDDDGPGSAIRRPWRTKEMDAMSVGLSRRGHGKRRVQNWHPPSLLALRQTTRVLRADGANGNPRTGANQRNILLFDLSRSSVLRVNSIGIHFDPNSVLVVSEADAA